MFVQPKRRRIDQHHSEDGHCPGYLKLSIREFNFWFDFDELYFILFIITNLMNLFKDTWVLVGASSSGHWMIMYWLFKTYKKLHIVIYG